MSKRLDLAFYLGATWEFDFVATDAAGAAIDLTGATVTWRLASTTTALVEVAAQIVTAATGRCHVKVLPTQQGLATPGQHRHEARVVQADGDVYVQIVGSFALKASLFSLPVSNVDGGVPLGLGGRWRGLYDPTRAFAAYDVVSYQGSSYIATAALAAGVSPANDDRWEIVAAGANDLPLFNADSPGLTPGSGGGTAHFLRADGVWIQPPVPELADVALSGSYDDLVDRPAIPVVPGVFDTDSAGLVPASGAAGTDSFLRADGVFAVPPGSGGGGGYDPADFASVAFSGDYTDLLNPPALFSGAYADLSGKPSLFSGSYIDLTNKPTIPAEFSGDLGTFATMGGVTSAFPALKRNGIGLNVRLADDSAFASLEVGGFQAYGSITLASNGYLQFASSTYLFAEANGVLRVGNSSDTNKFYLAADAANVLALRSGTASQKFRVYGSYTDAANNQRIEINCEGGATGAGIGYVYSGTGAWNTPLAIYTSGGELRLHTFNQYGWKIHGTEGHFLAMADNSWDIGASGANRPRNLYIAGTANVGSLDVGGNAFVGGNLEVLYGAMIFGVGGNRVRFGASANGRLVLGNSAGGPADMISFAGGNDPSTLPAIKRSGAELQIRLADDSNFADLRVKSLSTQYGASINAAGGVYIGSDYGLVLGNTAAVHVRADETNINHLSLGQKPWLSASVFNLYNTFTDAANYERLSLKWLSNEFRIETENAGTGVGRSILIKSSASVLLEAAWPSAIRFRIGGSDVWKMNYDNNFSPHVDNSQDIGTASRRVKDIHVAGAVRGTIVPPTTDPHIAGALWNNGGTLAISAG